MHPYHFILQQQLYCKYFDNKRRFVIRLGIWYEKITFFVPNAVNRRNNGTTGAVIRFNMHYWSDRNSNWKSEQMYYKYLAWIVFNLEFDCPILLEDILSHTKNMINMMAVQPIFPTMYEILWNSNFPIVGLVEVVCFPDQQDHIK